MAARIRFARRFDHASGRDAMFFNIYDAFFGGAEPLNGRYEIEVRVVYFDEGRGKWAEIRLRCQSAKDRPRSD